MAGCSELTRFQIRLALWLAGLPGVKSIPSEYGNRNHRVQRIILSYESTKNDVYVHSVLRVNFLYYHERASELSLWMDAFMESHVNFFY